MRITNLTVTDAVARPLAFEESAMSAASRRRSFDIPRFVVPAPDPLGVDVRYCARPGLETGDSHDELPDASYGILTSDLVVVRGRQIFLLPEMPHQVGTIEVVIDPAFQGETVVPWPKQGDAFRPDLAERGRGLEALIAGTVAIGSFTRSSIVRKSTEYEFALAPGIPTSGQAAALDLMTRIVRYVDDLVPGAFGDRYLTTIAPCSPTGSTMVGEAWLNGQSGSFVPATLGTLRQYARGLLTAAIRDRPSPLSSVGDDLRWIQDGAIEFHAWRALIAAGLLSESDVMNHLARAYLQNLGQPSARVDLSRAYDDGRPNSFVRQTVSPLAYAIVSDEVRAAGAVPKDPAYLLHVMLHARGDLTLDTILGDLTAEKRTFLERSVVHDRHTSLLDRFTFVPATSRTPRDPCTGPATRLRIIHTGNTEGYLETCGCKVNDSGGIARRATMLARLTAGASPFLLIDAGNFMPAPSHVGTSPDPIESKESAFHASFMARNSYDVVFPGTFELASGPADRERIVRTLPSYLAPHGQDAPGNAPVRSRRIERAGLTITAFALPDPIVHPSRSGQSIERLPEDERRDPVEVLRDALRDVDLTAGLIIVGGNLAPSTMRRLAAAHPEIDVLISTDNGLEATSRAVGDLRGYLDADEQGFLDNTLILYPTLGKYGVDSATVQVEAGHRICSAEFDADWLDRSVPEDPSTRRSLEVFYADMERTLDPGSVTSLKAGVPRGIAGAEACRSCHEPQFAQWKSTPHASAYKTLLDRHRHFHPRCVGCHVVGYGDSDGFRLARPDERLANVQCESCHGPGAAHAGSPSTANIRRVVDEEVCTSCHDQAHSDHFDYRTRLTRVQHATTETVARTGAGIGGSD